jgi:hypothetical protein
MSLKHPALVSFLTQALITANKHTFHVWYANMHFRTQSTCWLLTRNSEKANIIHMSNSRSCVVRRHELFFSLFLPQSLWLCKVLTRSDFVCVLFHCMEELRKNQVKRQSRKPAFGPGCEPGTTRIRTMNANHSAGMFLKQVVSDMALIMNSFTMRWVFIINLTKLNIIYTIVH